MGAGTKVHRLLFFARQNRPSLYCLVPSIFLSASLPQVQWVPVSCQYNVTVLRKRKFAIDWCYSFYSHCFHASFFFSYLIDDGKQSLRDAMSEALFCFAQKNSFSIFLSWGMEISSPTCSWCSQQQSQRSFLLPAQRNNFASVSACHM